MVKEETVRTAVVGMTLLAVVAVLIVGQTFCDLQTLLHTFFIFPGEY